MCVLEREVERVEADALDRRRDREDVAAPSGRWRPRGSGCRRAWSCRRSRRGGSRAPPGTAARRTRRLGVLGADLGDRAGDARVHRVHHLHHLDDADDRVRLHRARRRSTNGGSPGRRRAVEGAEHRRGDRDARRAGSSAATGAEPRRCGAGPAHVEREARRSRRAARRGGLVDDPQDLADVVVVQRHESFSPRAERAHHQRHRGCRRRRRPRAYATAVTGRDWTTKSLGAPSRAIAHSTSWCEPKCRSTRPATSTSAARPPRRDTATSRRSSARRPGRRRGRPRPARMQVLAWTCSRTISPRHLADEVVVRRHLAADDGEAEPPARVHRDHARVAAHGVAGEQHARDLGVDHQLHRDAHRRLLRSGPEPRAVADRRRAVEAHPAVAHRVADVVGAAHPEVASPAGRRTSRPGCPRRARSSGPRPAARPARRSAGRPRRAPRPGSARSASPG